MIHDLTVAIFYAFGRAIRQSFVVTGAIPALLCGIKPAAKVQ